MPSGPAPHLIGGRLSQSPVLTPRSLGAAALALLLILRSTAPALATGTRLPTMRTSSLAPTSVIRTTMPRWDFRGRQRPLGHPLHPRGLGHRSLLGRNPLQATLSRRSGAVQGPHNGPVGGPQPLRRLRPTTNPTRDCPRRTRRLSWWNLSGPPFLPAHRRLR